MKICIISPAGNIKGKIIDAGVQTLMSWGHEVSIAPHAKGSYGRFSGTPEERAADIIEALQDPEVDLLWASRGGYGCMQTLDAIPLSLIGQARKALIGYSDLTALHALWQKAGVTSLHAPMMKHLGEEPGHRTTTTLRQLLSYYAEHQSWPTRHNQLFLKKAKLYVAPGQGWMDAPIAGNALPTSDTAIEQWADTGEETPSFVGGNLSVLSGLHGTPYDFDYKGKILFLEDIAESPYKVDRMLQQLKLMGILGQIRGLVCGHFTGCDDDPSMPVRLWDNIRGIVAPHDIPLWLGAPIGHELENYPVVLDAPKRTDPQATQ